MRLIDRPPASAQIGQGFAMTTIIPQDLTCPGCDATFETRSVASTNSFGPRTTDFCQYAGGAQPLPFQVHTCPQCGFSGYEGDFADSALDPAVIGLIRERLAPLVAEARGDAARRFEFAAMIADWRGDTPFDIGWLYLKAAWCCQMSRADGGMTEAERGYREKAIASFATAVEQLLAPSDALLSCVYLVGEQYRRLGRPEQAAIWFDRVVATASDGVGDRRLAELAVQQRDQPREFFDERRPRR
jgi:uncharacterized protein (DUF2225 family)